MRSSLCSLVIVVVVRVVGAVGIVALASCAFPPTYVTPAVFDLDPTASQAGSTGTAAARPPLRLRSLEVSAASWLEGNQIAYKLAFMDPYRREAYRDARWAAPPAALVNQRVRLRLAQRTCTVARVASAPVLRIGIDEFTQVFSSAQRSRVQVLLRVSLGDGNGRASDAGAERVFMVERDASTPDAKGAVIAFSAALDQALDEVFAWALTASPARAC